MRKIAPETDNPQTSKALVTVALAGALRPKLMKIMVSQKTRIASMSFEIELLACAYINQRVSPRAIAVLVAWAWSERCVSFVTTARASFHRAHSTQLPTPAL
jgi:hypothetical protein